MSRTEQPPIVNVFRPTHKPQCSKQIQQMGKTHHQRFYVPATRPHSIEVLGTTIAPKKRHWWAFVISHRYSSICHAFFYPEIYDGKDLQMSDTATWQNGKTNNHSSGTSFPSHSCPRISVTWNPTQSLVGIWVRRLFINTSFIYKQKVPNQVFL